MNKKANRRAFFVCMFICFMYVALTMKLTEKMGFERVFDNQRIVPANMNISMQTHTPLAAPETASAAMPQKPLPETDTKVLQPAAEDAYIEPGLFISIPLVCLAIKARLLEKEGLISAGKGRSNTANWKKPIDILYDRDEEGLKNISKAIDAKHTLDFLKREGITLKQGLSAEEIILGRGYVVERKKLLSLYNSAVSDDYNRLFPFTVDGTGIVRHNNSFEFVTMKDEPKRQQAKEDTEWQMPNLLNLPMKVALEKLVAHTTRIKIHGSGIVMEQSPRPFQRLKGEMECTISGRMQR